MTDLFRPRIVFLAVFAVCAVLIAYALYLQHAQGLEPCPMCILQRYAFIAIGAAALVAAIVDPRKLALKIFSALVGSFAVLGGGVAIRHSWLQHFPNPFQSCGADLDYLLESLPLTRALPAIFRGTGSCSDVQWRFLGLSIPEWSLIWFFIFLVVAVMVVVRARKS